MAKYDYVVVGGGSAGCVTANRLVTEHGARVLLLEAGGGHRRFLVDVPAGSFKMMFGPGDYLKRYVSVPQAALDGRTVEIAQGNLIGGGSSVNALTYMRGIRADFDAWDAHVGGVGWGWDDLLPYFVRQEGNGRLVGAAHGADGPLAIQDHRFVCGTAHRFIDAMQALGVPLTDDFNAGDERGVGLTQITASGGKRCSAANAFLDPLRGNERLTVVSGARVERILFDGMTAVGVAFVKDGKNNRVFCEREVILTAGAFSTPKLLMLSGIGPGDQLKSHGIEVRLDLPGVGQNMQDHNMVPLCAYAHPGFGYFGQDKGLRAAFNTLRYLLFKQGPLATNGSEALAFVNLDDPALDPTVQIYCMGTMFLPPGVGEPGHGLMLCASIVRPKSLGWMRLRSANPQDDPEISPNYFTDPDDLKLMVRAVRYLRDILATEPLSAIVRREILPGGDVETDEAIAGYCRQATFTNYHPVGSCRMGPESDAMAVVDPLLRVRGATGLRVFDASIMPRIPSANTNAPVMALADRGVDLMTGRASLRPPTTSPRHS